jgi:hypothetical protein
VREEPALRRPLCVVDLAPFIRAFFSRFPQEHNKVLQFRRHLLRRLKALRSSCPMMDCRASYNDACGGSSVDDVRANWRRTIQRFSRFPNPRSSSKCDLNRCTQRCGPGRRLIGRFRPFLAAPRPVPRCQRHGLSTRTVVSRSPFSLLHTRTYLKIVLRRNMRRPSATT